MRAMFPPVTTSLIACALASGCFLDRAPLAAPIDGGGQPPIDAATGDAGRDEDARVPTPDGGRDGGGPVCAPTSPPTEVCDGVDNDCNPDTADGSGQATFGDPCLGAGCVPGTIVCTSAGLACSAGGGGTTEICNGADDDCDGMIDEDAGCPCDRRTFGGHVYLFCNETVDWPVARDRCPVGYALGRIDDRTEHDFVVGVADSIASDNWWFGASDVAPTSLDGSFRWLIGGDRVPLTGGAGFSNWGGGQPDGSADCLEVGMGSNGVGGFRGRWNDAPCTDDQRYVCESLASLSGAGG